jgi:hypothetical protein
MADIQTKRLFSKTCIFPMANPHFPGRGAFADGDWEPLLTAKEGEIGKKWPVYGLSGHALSTVA